MATSPLPEHWLRGALPGISPFLQPVAHSLLQARDEVVQLMQHFPDNLLWERPAGVASPGFHLQHLTGVLDRLTSYAEGRPLNDEQMAYLRGEGKPGTEPTTTAVLLANFCQQVEHTLQMLKAMDEKSLTEPRGVGRAQLPSTVLGLLFHAAEHTMRHTGQLLVTVKVLLQKETAQSH